MRIFKKVCLTGIMLFLICANTPAQFSNLIVFGDSLSDVGNFPESHRIYWDPSKGKIIGNAIAQFYVPFSNPVDTKTLNPGGFPWPTLDNQYLSTQPKIEGKKRAYRSIGWTEFFLNLAKSSHQTASDIIVPSTLLNTRKVPENFSFNFAWGYATSFTGCVNPYYKRLSCTKASVSKARAAYEKDPSVNNYNALEVPGFAMQIQLFFQQLNDKKIAITPHTQYVVWIGGNDLIIAGNALLKHHNPLPALALILGETAAHTVRGIETLIDQLPKTDTPKKIYVFTEYNPKLTPGFYHKPISGFGAFVVKSSNFFLRFYAAIFNLFSASKIIVVPTYDWYENAAKLPDFAATLGKSCQLYGGNYDNVAHIPADNCRHYLFWNDVHPAMGMQIITAQAFYKYLH